MILNLSERFLLIQLLPKKGHELTLLIAQDFEDKLRPTELERKQWKITQEGQEIKWDPETDTEVEFDISTPTFSVITNLLQKREEKEELLRTELTLFKKFVTSKAVEG